MRIGALFLVGLGFVFAAACTSSTSADMVCNSGGGTCLAEIDGGLPATCGEVQSGLACDQGYVCCVLAPVPGPPTDAVAPTNTVDAASPAKTDAATKS